MSYNLITILGVTTSGKTALAVAVADSLNGEIISADSRQVYRNMNIGTGKDLSEYQLNGKTIPYHLIDIVDAGYKYNLFEFQRDFKKAFNDIQKRNKQAILCGGSGLYIEAALKGYQMEQVPIDKKLRSQLSEKSLYELTEILSTYKSLHNTTDTDTTEHAIRAIEIASFQQKSNIKEVTTNKINSIVVGIDVTRDERRKKISTRLKQRFDEGMINEVEHLLDSGIAPNDLIYYGLEYKFVTRYILGELTQNELFEQLETAIHQFAKRQMTWFRGMERRGIRIHWIDINLPTEEKVARIKNLLSEKAV